jgi:hypothetical protein
MNSYFPDRNQTIESHHASVFNEVRKRLVQEAPCRALADLLESVNAMQRAQAAPEEYDLRFEEFVYRAEDYMVAVRPFFPALVVFLSSRGDGDGIEPRNVKGSSQTRFSAEVA